MSSPRRYTPQAPCPICQGHPDLPDGQGRRCAGFHSRDGNHPRCTREEHAGALPLDPKTEPATYVHRLGGPCRCGVTHDAQPASAIADTLGRRSSLDDWSPMMPVPDYAPTPTFWRKDKRPVTGAPWAYRDAQGRALYYRARLEKDGGGKEVKPYAFCEGPGGERKWVWKGPATGRRQVYNQNGLAARPDAPVLVSEGEKSADAAAELVPDHVSITWDGGADGVRHVDWRPVAGRRLVLWPDADRPERGRPDGKGARAMHDVAVRALVAGAAEVRIIELPAGMADHYAGWDLADLGDADRTPAWMTPALVAELIATAPVFQVAPHAEAPADDATGAPPPAARTILDPGFKNAPESVAAETVAGLLWGRFRFHYATDRWYGYDAARGTWAPAPKAIVHAAIARTVDAAGLAPKGYGERYITSILGLLRGPLGVHEWSTRAGFANGVLVDGQLCPHAPEHLLVNALPYPYDPTAEPGPVVDWMTEAMGGDADLVHVLRCGLNAILNGRADIQVFLELLGPGGAGKGTFMRLCQSLVGGHASVATELKRLEENRFEPARLRDKLLIQINDSDKYGGDVSMLKRLTGGDAIPFEEKGKQSPGDFRAAGVVVVTCNEPIRSSDYTSGLARRRITIQFGQQIDMADARDLEAEFAPYLPGVYNWANALQADRVARDLRNASTNVAAIAALREEVEHETNPIAAWTLEKLYYLPSARAKVGDARRIPARAGTGPAAGDLMGRDDARAAYYLDADRMLYASYRDWCDGAGVQAVALNRFTKNLVDLLANQYKLQLVFKRRTNDGVHVFGVTLAAEATDDGLPVPVGEARELRRRSVKVVKDGREAFTPKDRHPVGVCEGREGCEGHMSAGVHAHAHTGAQAPTHMRMVGDVSDDPSPGTQPSQIRSASGIEAREGYPGVPAQPSRSLGKVVDLRAPDARRAVDSWGLPAVAGELETGDVEEWGS